MKKEIKNKFIFLIYVFIVLASVSILSLNCIGAQTFVYSPNIQEQEMSTEISGDIYNTASQIKINLTFFPLSDERQISSIKTDPTATTTDDAILFYFNEEGKLSFHLFSNITTNFFLKKFLYLPIKEIKKINSSEFELYKKPTNYIDSDNILIKNKAEQLTQNTNNSIEALYILAEYVYNSMNYDLKTDGLKKASEIIEEKRGVCAHYTILFTALTKSLGFPSRYVSGVAYSNKINDFEEHAWAEIYLPNYGWIPYDTTFGQYGWLDTSHIALKKSLDAGEPSVKYTYSGGYIQPEQISTKTKVIKYTKRQFSDKSNITIYAEPYREKISQDSYLPIKIKIKNNNSYYVALPIQISTAPDVYGKIQKILFLAPNSTRETYFIVYIPYEKKCSLGCITYVEFVDLFEDSSRINITFSDYFEKISLKQALEIANETQIKEIDFYCKPKNLTKEDYKSDKSLTENKTVVCSIKCKESESLKICYEDICVEKKIEKNRTTEIPIDLKTNQSVVCLKLEDLNDSKIILNSCVSFQETKKQFFIEKIFIWIKFQLTNFISFINKL